MSSPCERCETTEVGVRIGRLCVWCYAVQRSRPDDVPDGFGEVVEA